MQFGENYIRLRAEIERCCKDAGREQDPATLLAVSKTVGPEEVEDVYQAGCRDFGENRSEGLLEKSAAFPDARWHFIGNIQSRRIRDIVSCAYLIHSVCKAEHLKKIDDAAADIGKVQKILIEVNVSGEESKSGVTPSDAKAMLEQCQGFDHIECVGLMTMAPLGDLEVARYCFKELRELERRLGVQADSDSHGQRLSQLSMGMTDDWRIAIEEGSTIVRLGRAIFS